MRIPTLVAIVVTLCALPAVAGELPTAPAPRAVAARAAVVKLRNVAAADAAHALGEFVKGRKLEAVVVAEPVSNTVLLSADPALTRQLLDILAKIDEPRPQIMVSALVLQAPDPFVERAGLNVGPVPPGATSWTLSPREHHMLMEIIRWAKARNECEVLARPNLQLTENQTGTVRVGQDYPVVGPFLLSGKEIAVTRGEGDKPSFVPVGITFRATPRVKPDGGVRLRCAVQITEHGKPVAMTTTIAGFPYPLTSVIPSFKTQSLETTAELKAGEILVARAGDYLVIVTPTVIAK